MFQWLVYGAPIGGRVPIQFPDDEGWDLLVQKCTCIAMLTLVTNIPAPALLRCRPSLNRCGFSLNAQKTSIMGNGFQPPVDVQDLVVM